MIQSCQNVDNNSCFTLGKKKNFRSVLYGHTGEHRYARGIPSIHLVYVIWRRSFNLNMISLTMLEILSMHTWYRRPLFQISSTFQIFFSVDIASGSQSEFLQLCSPSFHLIVALLLFCFFFLVWSFISNLFLFCVITTRIVVPCHYSNYTKF